jgi:hypothetical protein
MIATEYRLRTFLEETQVERPLEVGALHRDSYRTTGEEALLGDHQWGEVHRALLSIVAEGLVHHAAEVPDQVAGDLWRGDHQ